MKFFLLIVSILLGGYANGQGTYYYVSSSMGNDNNNGSIGAPWKTLNKVASYDGYKAGDVIHLKSGDVWIGESLNAWKTSFSINTAGTTSNPIIITAYGSGNKPFINVVSNQNLKWTNQGNNVWTSSNIGFNPRRLFKNRVEILGGPDWELGKRLPDLVEWYFNGNGITLYSINDPNSDTFSFSNQPYGAYFNEPSNIIVDGLKIKGGYISSFSLRYGENFKIINNDLGGAAYHGIDLINDHQTNNGINKDIIVDKNIIDAEFDFNYTEAGTRMGVTERGSSEGIFVRSTFDSQISNNYVKNYSHANLNIIGQMNGDIEINQVSRLKVFGNTFTAPDIAYGGRLGVDGACYDNEFYNNLFIDIPSENQINGAGGNHMHHNIFRNIKNSPLKGFGTGQAISLQGYYSKANGLIFENNLIIDCDRYGIYLMNDKKLVQNNIFRNNILYNCGIAVGYDVNSNNVRDNTFKNNLIFDDSNKNTIDYFGIVMDVAKFNSQTRHGNTARYNISDNPLIGLSGNKISLDKNSPAIDRGAAPKAKFDIDGNPIPFNNTAPDIGPKESGYENGNTGFIKADAGKDQTICAGSSAVLTASGGSSFLWSTGATTKSITVSPKSTTTYHVTISEGASSGTDEVLVTVNALPVANAGADVSIEAGQSTTLTASGGDTYLWSTGETTASITVKPASSTIYEVIVYKDGCESSDSVKVTVNNASTGSGIVADAGKDVSICSGSNAILTASGGSVYTWSNGLSGNTIIVSPDKTTTYTVTVSDGVNTATDNVTVTVQALPVANAGADVSIDAGQSTILTASGGDTYLWSTGETTASITVKPDSTTNYEVTVTSGGCSLTDTVTVSVNASAPPATNVVADAGQDIVICKGNSAVLTASGGTSYIWSKGERTKSIVVSPEITTTYSVTVIDGSSSNTADVTVYVTDLPFASAGNDITIEAGQSAVLTAGGGDQYTWNTGETTKEITVNPSVTTTYEVIVGKNGCESTDKVQVTVKEVPPAAANAGSDLTICMGESITLKGDGGATYSWNTGASSQNITVSPKRTTTYTLTANRGGTTSTDEVTVTVINCDLNNGVNNSVSGATGNPATNDTATQDDEQILNKADFELTVYPNPTEGKINVQTTVPIYNFNLVLMNINGNVIYSDEMDAAEDGINKEIDLSRFAKGVYLLQLYNEEDSFVKKVIVI